MSICPYENQGIRGRNPSKIRACGWLFRVLIQSKAVELQSWNVAEVAVQSKERAALAEHQGRKETVSDFEFIAVRIRLRGDLSRLYPARSIDLQVDERLHGVQHQPDLVWRPAASTKFRQDQAGGCNRLATEQAIHLLFNQFIFPPEIFNPHRGVNEDEQSFGPTLS